MFETLQPEKHKMDNSAVRPLNETASLLQTNQDKELLIMGHLVTRSGDFVELMTRGTHDEKDPFSKGGAWTNMRNNANIANKFLERAKTLAEEAGSMEKTVQQHGKSLTVRELLGVGYGSICQKLMNYGYNEGTLGKGHAIEAIKDGTQIAIGSNMSEVIRGQLDRLQSSRNFYDKKGVLVPEIKSFLEKLKEKVRELNAAGEQPHLEPPGGSLF